MIININNVNKHKCLAININPINMDRDRSIYKQKCNYKLCIQRCAAQISSSPFSIYRVTGNQRSFS